MPQANDTKAGDIYPGALVITAGARNTLDEGSVLAALTRHLCKRDWGDLCAEDKAQNDAAMERATRGPGNTWRPESRLLSAYSDKNGVKFWIITDAGSYATTVLLPEEY